MTKIVKNQVSPCVLQPGRQLQKLPPLRTYRNSITARALKHCHPNASVGAATTLGMALSPLPPTLVAHAKGQL